MNRTAPQYSRQSNVGQSDALAVIGMLAIGALGVIVALVVLDHVLAIMPAEFAAAVAFSMIVFAVVCGAAFLRRKDAHAHTDHPPVLVFPKGRGRAV